jgi:Derlin-2/3
LLTNFFYFGPINFDFLFHMFFMMRYFRILEDQSFHRRPADFLFMLLFGSSILLVIGTVMHITFLSAAMTFMVIYLWARRNPAVTMNFLGVFNFPAPYMPFILLGFSFVLNGTLPKSDALGIFVGHLYYYGVDIYPRAAQGRRLLNTPYIL